MFGTLGDLGTCLIVAGQENPPLGLTVALGFDSFLVSRLGALLPSR